jgi:hypothetical protein
MKIERSCRSYGAWKFSLIVPINMALLRSLEEKIAGSIVAINMSLLRSWERLATAIFICPGVRIDFGFSNTMNAA